MTKDPAAEPSSIHALLSVMAALRAPGSGCPWDLEQTFTTIAPYTIEEAYEVAEAIERGDLADLKEELGDLLFQVVYHSRIAEEQGAFDFYDVAQAIAVKMTRRHPHVFGTASERAAGAAPGFWSRIKREEQAAKVAVRQASASSARAEPASLLDDVPVALPALTRAVKLQGKAAIVGFDWPSLGPVFAKMREELHELEVAIETGGNEDVDEEFGDLLFVVANVARHLKIDPETALRGANSKFVRRFAHIERRLQEVGRAPETSSLEEMDTYWDEAKAEERRGVEHSPGPRRLLW